MLEAYRWALFSVWAWAGVATAPLGIRLQIKFVAGLATAKAEGKRKQIQRS